LQIKAALSSGAASPFEITDVELDEPRADEVLVRLAAAGICHTDLTMKAASRPSGRRSRTFAPATGCC
jgi:aryl-alcohol dehydrogenase